MGEASLLEGLHEADAAFVLASLYRRSAHPCLCVCKDNRRAERMADNLRFFLSPEAGHPVLLIPGSEADPYRGLSAHPEIAANRAMGLWKLLRGRYSIAVTTVTALVTRVPGPETFLSSCMQLEVGAFVPLQHFLEKLRQSGYVREDPVSEMGEYSRRGGIVDVFSAAHENPLRIEFFGDEIESIREFDPGTQRSIRLIPGCEIAPMREMVLSEIEIARWHEAAPEHWKEIRFAEALKEKRQFTDHGELFNGFEYLLPLVIRLEHSLLDFAQRQGRARLVVAHASDLREELEGHWARWNARFQEQQAAGELALSPEALFLNRQWFEDRIEEEGVLQLESLAGSSQQAPSLNFQAERKYRARLQDLLTDLSAWRAAGDQVVFVMGSRGMAERLIDIFEEYGLTAPLSENVEESLSQGLSITWGKLSQGFYAPALKLHLLNQENVFEGPARPVTSRPPPKREVGARFFSDFRDLKEGDYVVHLDHGIARFAGLKKIGIDEQVSEFVVLLYRDQAKLYVPVDHLDSIQKYSSAGDARPRIDRLGGVSWARTKKRIKKSMRNLAEDLLKLYARRQMARGHAFSGDDFLMREFEEAFQYEETPDQLGAIRDVKRDMEGTQPMDRLVCGDVGYGKTEVAMRAAFKAVKDGKQVALLSPTTVLAFQHFRTFRERFEGFPVRIEMISRLQSRQEQKAILEQTSLGTVDVLIGTHRLLSKDVHFQDLGLIVVDEEQRFGVAQKERLKSFKTQVEVLSLSATPIPRTLNMSLTGLRDLSIIETPPKDRLSIQTVVVKFSRNIVRSAIDLELKRQGQVLFVHNSIETIHSIAHMVQEMMPEARVAFAHGRMRERQLEQVMLDFVDYQFDVLVCTTIVENGLDIPRANTLIVNRAGRFGLAQLYQLRGRVGRSSRRAYAYLLIPSEEILAPDARRRLAAIKEFSDLGSGFRLAALDLEIRGAGNMLGAEQHGHINAVGFELYMKLLEQTIRELQGEDIPEEVETSIDLRFDVQIPEHYIEDSNLRLWLYKRVSSARSREALEDLKGETVDRFGSYPRSVDNLFEYARLRLRAQELKITAVERKGLRLCLKFRQDTPVSPRHLIALVRGDGGLSLNPDGVLAAPLREGGPPEVFRQVDELLKRLDVVE